jgi:tRNA nucleotidyltransferase/poly(A) polymerase
MSEGKSKDKRLEEKEKWDAETERSLSVARFKKAHKEIEDTEKERKRPAILSICKRIDFSIKDIIQTAKLFNKNPFLANLSLSQRVLIHVQNYQENYDSIRADLQKSLEIKDEDMKKLFPEIEIDETNYGHVTASLSNIMTQLRHMKFYCERLL